MCEYLVCWEGHTGNTVVQHVVMVGPRHRRQRHAEKPYCPSYIWPANSTLWPRRVISLHLQPLQSWALVNNVQPGMFFFLIFQLGIQGLRICIYIIFFIGSWSTESLLFFTPMRKEDLKIFSAMFNNSPSFYLSLFRKGQSGPVIQRWDPRLWKDIPAVVFHGSSRNRHNRPTVGS